MKPTVNLKYNGDVNTYIPDQTFVPEIGSRICINYKYYRVKSMSYHYETSKYEDKYLDCICLIVEED